MVRAAALLIVLLAIGCERGCTKVRDQRGAAAEAIASGDVEALRKTLDEWKNHSSIQEATLDIQALRKQRPITEWASIIVKRNQLIGIRFLRSDPQMCPESGDAGDVRVADSLKDALSQGVDATKRLWNEVGLHRVRGTPLHLAAFFCQPSMIALLLKTGAEANAPDDLGMTALHWASCEQVANALIAAKANVNAASRDGWTPLHMAVSAPVVRVLVANGAQVNVRDACGNEPMHIAAYFGLSGNRRSAATSEAGTELVSPESPRWFRLLMRLAGELEQSLDFLNVLFDVGSELLNAGADSGATNAVGTLPEAVISGGGDFD